MKINFTNLDEILKTALGIPGYTTFEECKFLFELSKDSNGVMIEIGLGKVGLHLL